MSVLNSSKSHRRLFMKLLGASVPAATLLKTASAFGTGKKQLVKIVEFDASGVRTGVVEVEKIEKPLAE